MLKYLLLSLICFSVFAEATPTPTAEDKAAKEDAKECSDGASSCGCKH